MNEKVNRFLEKKRTLLKPQTPLPMLWMSLDHHQVTLQQLMTTLLLCEKYEYHMKQVNHKT